MMKDIICIHIDKKDEKLETCLNNIIYSNIIYSENKLSYSKNTVLHFEIEFDYSHFGSVTYSDCKDYIVDNEFEIIREIEPDNYSDCYRYILRSTIGRNYSDYYTCCHAAQPIYIDSLHDIRSDNRFYSNTHFVAGMKLIFRFNKLSTSFSLTSEFVLDMMNKEFVIEANERIGNGEKKYLYYIKPMEDYFKAGIFIHNLELTDPEQVINIRLENENEFELNVNASDIRKYKVGDIVSFTINDFIRNYCNFCIRDVEKEIEGYTYIVTNIEISSLRSYGTMKVKKYKKKEDNEMDKCEKLHDGSTDGPAPSAPVFDTFITYGLQHTHYIDSLISNMMLLKDKNMISKLFKMKDIKFNSNNSVIVLWEDGTKTIVTMQKDEKSYDLEKAVIAAYTKKILS